MALRDEVPKPTGVIHTWWVEDLDLYQEIHDLLAQMRNWTNWDDREEYEKAKERLTSLPGFPKMAPGDHIRLGFRARPSILVPGRIH